MLPKISALSCWATRYIDAHPSCAQSESGKQGTRGRGFHKSAEESGTQSDLSIVERERNRESAEKEDRSRLGGGRRRHGNQRGTAPRWAGQRSSSGRARPGEREYFSP